MRAFAPRYCCPALPFIAQRRHRIDARSPPRRNRVRHSRHQGEQHSRARQYQRASGKHASPTLGDCTPTAKLATLANPHRWSDLHPLA